MKKYLYYVLFILLCLTIGIAGVSAGYRWYARRESATVIEAVKPPRVENDSARNADTQPEAEQAAAMFSQSVTKLEALSEDEPVDLAPYHGGVRITPVTQMVYEYCYDDGRVESSREDAPYFLLDMGAEKLEEMFPDWEVTVFTEDEVVMRKYVPGKSGEYYIVGIQDGYVAVFYQQPVNGTKLKEITNTPVHTLSSDERQRLADGIQIQGNDRLAKVMEDYGS